MADIKMKMERNLINPAAYMETHSHVELILTSPSGKTKTVKGENALTDASKFYLKFRNLFDAQNSVSGYSVGSILDGMANYGASGNKGFATKSRQKTLAVKVIISICLWSDEKFTFCSYFALQKCPSR